MKLILCIISIQLVLIMWKLCEISTQVDNFYILLKIKIGHIEDYLKKGQKHE